MSRLVYVNAGYILVTLTFKWRLQQEKQILSFIYFDSDSSLCYQGLSYRDSTVFALLFKWQDSGFGTAYHLDKWRIT